MGLFGGRTSHYSGSVYTPFETNKLALPVTIQAAVIRSIVTNEMPYVVDNVVNDIIDSSYTKTRIYARYANSDKNPFKQSKVSLSKKSTNTALIKAYLQLSHDEPLTLLYASKDNFNFYHYAYERLTLKYGFIQDNNTIVDGDIPKYIGNIQVILDKADFPENAPDGEDEDEDEDEDEETQIRDFFAFLDTPYTERDSEYGYVLESKGYIEGDTDKVEIELYWKENEEDLEIQTEIISFEIGSNIPIELYLLKYSIDNRLYYKTISDIPGGVTENLIPVGSNMGFIEPLFLRDNKSNLWNAPKYKDYIYKCDKKLSLNLDTVLASVKKSRNYRDFQDIAVMFAIPLGTELQVGKDYIYEFFFWLNSRLSGSQNENVSVKFENAINVMTLSFGSITAYLEDWSYNKEQDITMITPKIEPRKNGISAFPGVIPTVRGITIKKPISKTKRQVFEIRTPKMHYTIPMKANSAGIGSLGKKDSALVIPLSTEILNSHKFTYTQKEQILAASRGLLITWSVRVKISRWKRNLGSILQIVAIAGIVVSIVTGPIGAAIYAGASAAAIALAVVLQVVIAIALQIIVKAAVILIAKVFGDKIAGIFAALVTIAVMAYGRSMSNQGFFASTLVQAGSLAAPTTTEYYNDKAKKLMEDASKTAEQKEKELAEINDKLAELKKGTIVNPYDTWDNNSKLMHPTESVTSFIDRLIHTGNIGVLALSYPENYVQMSLDKNMQII